MSYLSEHQLLLAYHRDEHCHAYYGIDLRAIDNLGV